MNRAEFINAWKEEISQYWNQAKLFLKNNYMYFIQQTSAKSEVDQEICLKHSSSSAGWASLRGRSRLCRRWSRRCIRGTWWGDAGEGHRQVYILTVGERIEALVVNFSLEERKPLLQICKKSVWLVQTWCLWGRWSANRNWCWSSCCSCMSYWVCDKADDEQPEHLPQRCMKKGRQRRSWVS